MYAFRPGLRGGDLNKGVHCSYSIAMKKDQSSAKFLYSYEYGETHNIEVEIEV